MIMLLIRRTSELSDCSIGGSLSVPLRSRPSRSSVSTSLSVSLTSKVSSGAESMTGRALPVAAPILS
jgi:hypothetical protein